jgi:hypothetical protein
MTFILYSTISATWPNVSHSSSTCVLNIWRDGPITAYWHMTLQTPQISWLVISSFSGTQTPFDLLQAGNSDYRVSQDCSKEFQSLSKLEWSCQRRQGNSLATRLGVIRCVHPLTLIHVHPAMSESQERVDDRVHDSMVLFSRKYAGKLADSGMSKTSRHSWETC